MNNTVYATIGASFVALSMITCNQASNNKTDGVFESALHKIENNQPLSPAEEQRVDDIMNWCDTCDKPIRMCRHK